MPPFLPKLSLARRWCSRLFRLRSLALLRISRFFSIRGVSRKGRGRVTCVGCLLFPLDGAVSISRLSNTSRFDDECPAESEVDGGTDVCLFLPLSDADGGGGAALEAKCGLRYEVVEETGGGCKGDAR